MAETVVVVDDDPVIQAILAAVLSSGGYRVEPASEASGAVPAVRRARPVAVLVDRMMPGQDGIDVCRDLRAEPDPSLRPSIVLLTADADRVPPQLAADAGIDAVVAKPFEPAQLLELLDRLRHGDTGTASAPLR